MLFKYLRRAKSSNQRGSLMVEAIAMLGLIAMVTPMLYKKAAERTTEIEDINLANNARLISKALDSYITAHREDIEDGSIVNVSCATGADSSVDYSAGWSSEEVFGVQHLCEFLPTGYVGKNKTFSDIQVSIKKYQNPAAENTIGGAFAMKPTDTSGLPKIRTSRIASMIGANGGFTSESSSDSKAYGVQGAWEVDVGDYFSGSWKPGPGAIVVTSFNTGVKDNKGYLYRHAMPGSPELNQMFTNLHMGDNSIHSIEKIVIGDDLSSAGASDAIYIANDSGAVDFGNADVSTTGDLSVADISAVDVSATDVSASGVSTGTLTATGATTLAATTVGGILTVNDTTNLNNHVNLGDDDTDEITINGNAKFNANTVIGRDGSDLASDTLTVNATTTFASPATFNNTLTADSISAGSLTTSGNVDVGGNLNVLGTTDLAGNTTIGGTLTTTGAAQFDSTAQFDGVATFNERPVFNKGFSTDFISDNGSTDNDGHLTIEDNAGIRLQNSSDTTKRLDVSFGSGETGVYVRKGFIDTTDTSTATSNNTENYIKTHRLTTNEAFTVPYSSGQNFGYNNFEVNPAYTSVMNDIKLASRGGARLSEILPDFITKQIYVLDASYRQCPAGEKCGAPGEANSEMLKWTELVPPQKFDSGVFSDDGDASPCTNANCEVSEWLGFIPAPVCPQNYSAIVTLSPVRWKMSNAHYATNNPYKPGGTPVDFKYLPNQGKGDKYEAGLPKDPITGYPVALKGPTNQIPLTYQTNTWLAATIESHCTKDDEFGKAGERGSWSVAYNGYTPAITVSTNKIQCSNLASGGTFWGWSGIMGFIYPEQAVKPGGGSDSFVWNPYPVYNTELSATATVYCLFMRRNPSNSSTWGSSRWNEDIVDVNYDQLRNFHYTTEKHSNTQTSGTNKLFDPVMGRSEDRTTSSLLGNTNQ